MRHVLIKLTYIYHKNNTARSHEGSWEYMQEKQYATVTTTTTATAGATAATAVATVTTK